MKDFRMILPNPASDTAGAASLLFQLNGLTIIHDAAGSMINLPGTDLEDVIGIDPADFTDAVYMQDEGMGGNEALVLRAQDEKAAERIVSMLEGYLEQRRKETRNYVPEAYQLLEKAKVERKNLTVALISGEKAAEESAALLAGE